MLGQTLRIAIAVSILAFIMLLALPKPDVILSVSARSQVFEYRVFNKESSSLLLTNVKLISLPQDVFENDVSIQCLSGEVIFNTNTNVKFRRGTPDAAKSVAISFPKNRSEISGQIITLANGAIDLNINDTLIIDPEDTNCSGALPSRLSIWGNGAIGNLRTIGSSDLKQNGDLIEGHVRISARAVEKIFKIFKGAEGLYEAGVVNLPFGTRLESDNYDRPANNNVTGQWVGLARMITIDGIHSFQIDFSTDDQRVWLHRPGVRELGKPDPIGATAFVSQTKDPGIIRFQVFIAAIFLILQTVASLVQTIEIQPKNKGRKKWHKRLLTQAPDGGDDDKQNQ